MTTSVTTNEPAAENQVSPDDIAFMREALKLARRAATQGEVPVGAIVIKNGQVVGSGFNQPRLSHDPSAHAEICALRGAGQSLQNYRLPGCTLYVTIEPCTMCLGAMIHARIARLVFGAPEPRYGAVASGQRLLDNVAYNHQLAVTGGVLAAEAGELMKQFFRQRREASAAHAADAISSANSQ